MSPRIDYYFSFPSPWAYIGHAAFEDVAKANGCTVNYKPVLLGDLFAETGGLPLTKRHPVRQRYRLVELQRWREKRGLSFSLHPRHWPFDAKRSMLDVTTVMVASEFGRTMRAPEMPIQATGTNHNQFANTILLGGKGIRTGLVIGATDLVDEKDTPSRAHFAMDPALEKVMGRPIDFTTLRVRPVRPDAFDIEDCLTIGSVVNTLYAAFCVPKSRYRSNGRNLPSAPVLDGLLA